MQRLQLPHNEAPDEEQDVQELDLLLDESRQR